MSTNVHWALTPPPAALPPVVVVDASSDQQIQSPSIAVQNGDQRPDPFADLGITSKEFNLRLSRVLDDPKPSRAVAREAVHLSLLPRINREIQIDRSNQIKIEKLITSNKLPQELRLPLSFFVPKERELISSKLHTQTRDEMRTHFRSGVTDAKTLAIQASNAVEGYDFNSKGLRMAEHQKPGPRTGDLVRRNAYEYLSGRKRFAFKDFSSDRSLRIEERREVMSYIAQALREDRALYYKRHPESINPVTLEKIVKEYEICSKDSYVDLPFSREREQDLPYFFEAAVRKLLLMEPQIRTVSTEKFEEFVQEFKKHYTAVFETLPSASLTVAATIAPRVLNKPAETGCKPYFIERGTVPVPLAQLSKHYSVRSVLGIFEPAFKAYERFFKKLPPEVAEKWNPINKKINALSEADSDSEMKRVADEIKSFDSNFYIHGGWGGETSSLLPKIKAIPEKVMAKYGVISEENEAFLKEFRRLVSDLDLAVVQDEFYLEEVDVKAPRSKCTPERQIDEILRAGQALRKFLKERGKDLPEINSEIGRVHHIEDSAALKAIREAFAGSMPLKSALLALSERMKVSGEVIDLSLCEGKQLLEAADLLAMVGRVKSTPFVEQIQEIAALQLLENVRKERMTAAQALQLLAPIAKQRGVIDDRPIEEALIQYRDRSLMGYSSMRRELANSEIAYAAMKKSYINMDGLCQNAISTLNQGFVGTLSQLLALFGKGGGENLGGQVSFEDTVTGTMRVIPDLGSPWEVKPGDIVVFPHLPHQLSRLINAAAIISEEGGPLSHAAQIIREFNIPALIGVRNAIQQCASLKNRAVQLNLRNQGQSQLFPYEGPLVKAVRKQPLAPKKVDASNRMGGKGVGLILLNYKIGSIPVHKGVKVRVPDFDVFETGCAAEFYEAPYKDTTVKKAIQGILSSELPLRNKHEQIKAIFQAVEIPQRLKEKIVKMAKSLGCTYNQPLIARSSASSEDGIEKSFSGMFSSVENLMNVAEVERSYKSVLLSAFSEEVLAYSDQFDPFAMAVILQRYESQPTFSGVASSCKGKEPLVHMQVVEKGGCGVDGKGNPDVVAVDTQNQIIEEMYPGGQFTPLLSPAQYKKMASVIKSIEKELEYPVSVEFTIHKKWNEDDFEIAIHQCSRIG